LEIFVELIGDEMGGHVFIDVLVKSTKTKLETLQLMNDHVLSQIEHFGVLPKVIKGLHL
jgi:hypothetical protein